VSARHHHDVPPVRLDEELLEQFRDEPELLAIADALQATQRQRASRRRIAPLAAVAAALGLAAVVAVTAADVSSASIVDDARSALEDGPVLHAVVDQQLPDDFVVDLQRGVRTPSTEQTAVWFDTVTGRVQVASHRNGELVSVSSGATVPAAQFLKAYREALAGGSVSQVSEARRSFAIRTRDLHGVVVLGADDLPTRFTPRGGRAIRFERFAATNAVPVSPPPAGQRGGDGSVISKQATSLAQASAVVGFKVLGPSRLAGLKRQQVILERLAAEGSDGAVVDSGVSILYSDGRRFIALRQARTPAPAYGFSRGLTQGGNPIPRSPRLDLRTGPGERIGQFRLGARFVTIRASNPDLVIEAAAQLSR
jgi:hypothetical protein